MCQIGCTLKRRITLPSLQKSTAFWRDALKSASRARSKAFSSTRMVANGQNHTRLDGLGGPVGCADPIAQHATASERTRLRFLLDGRGYGQRPLRDWRPAIARRGSQHDRGAYSAILRDETNVARSCKAKFPLLDELRIEVVRKSGLFAERSPQTGCPVACDDLNLESVLPRNIGAIS